MLKKKKGKKKATSSFFYYFYIYIQTYSFSIRFSQPFQLIFFHAKTAKKLSAEQLICLLETFILILNISSPSFHPEYQFN